MMTTATYPAAMAGIKSEPVHSGAWSNYGNSVVSTSTSPPHSARPRSGHQGSDQAPYAFGRYHPDDMDHYDRNPQSILTPLSGFSSMKRTFSQTEQVHYQELVQDVRDSASSKLSVGHDHKLLSFKRAPEKHTLVDQRGLIQQVELSAQLHGMFFLSEMSSANIDGVLQPELTCYRRNLFQVSGSLVVPRGHLSVLADSGDPIHITSSEVTISAIESVDGNPVRLIVIPWKTPPPNTPDVNLPPDQEPASLPLIPCQTDEKESDGEFAVYPIGWRRLQFRVATANNGRRKELQQHFVLHLKVVGSLGNGTQVILAESTTSPIVVRGRSPRNFQTRKEIPLLGSSAGSRGQALVETGLGIVAGPLKPQEAKMRDPDMQVPRSAFTFASMKVPTAQAPAARSSSYPPWHSASPVSVPVSGAGTAYTPTTTGNDSPYPRLPIGGAESFTTEPQELPMPSPLSIGSQDPQPNLRTQYTYIPTSAAGTAVPMAPTPGGSDMALSVPRYVGNNPRPTKSPRGLGQQSVAGVGPGAHDGAPEYRYSSYAAMPGSAHAGAMGSSSTYPTESSGTPVGGGPGRECYPPASTWTTPGGDSTGAIGGVYTSHEARPYTYPPSNYRNTSGMSQNAVSKSDQHSPHVAQAVYSGGNPTYDYGWSTN